MHAQRFWELRAIQYSSDQGRDEDVTLEASGPLAEGLGPCTKGLGLAHGQQGAPWSYAVRLGLSRLMGKCTQTGPGDPGVMKTDKHSSGEVVRAGRGSWPTPQVVGHWPVRPGC